MTYTQRIVIKLSLYLFFFYVLATKFIESFYFINDGIFDTVLAIIGLFIVRFSTIKYGLLYRLLIFPIVGSNIYELYVKPHFGSILHNLDVFWLFYLVIIGFITFRNKIWVLFFISIFGLFISFNNLPRRIWQSIRYWNQFESVETPSPIVPLVKNFQKDQKLIYLICLDGYPDFELEKKELGSQLSSYLLANGFKKHASLSLGDTPQSVPFLLFNRMPKNILFGMPFMNYNAHFRQFMKETYGEESLKVRSIFGNYWFISRFFPFFPETPLNYYLKKILKKVVIKVENPFEKEYVNAYHNELIEEMRSKEKIQFYHFITFHGLGYSGDRNMKKDVIYADYWLKRAISKINKTNPQSHIIVFSDHGERFMKGFNRKFSILYVK